MVVGGLDITEGKVRARQVDPEEFDPNGLGKGQRFKTIRLASGVKAIVGVKKGESGSSIQSILFDKDRFTPEQAKMWLKKNSSKFTDAVRLENEKVSLFEEQTLQEHLEGHLPPLTESQIMRLLELVGPPEMEDGESVEEEEYTSRFVKRI